MAPSNAELNAIAKQAELDLNSYQAKQGLNNSSLSEAGVDAGVEKKFPGAQVKYGEDLSTSASYNKRIPPEEGGELDARGRYVCCPKVAPTPKALNWHANGFPPQPTDKPAASTLRASGAPSTRWPRPSATPAATTTTTW